MHSDMIDLDFRKPENRKEGFILFYAASLMMKDMDPELIALRYLCDKGVIKDKWFASWLFPTSFESTTTLLFLTYFPEYATTEYEALKKFNDDNYHRLRYSTDTRYNKGHAHTMFDSYKKFIGDKSQEEFFQSMMKDTPEQSFTAIWDKVIKELHKFGRVTSWDYLHCLQLVCDLPIEPPNLMIGDSGSRSHRNGIILMKGWDDLYDAQLDKATVASLEDEMKDILAEVKQRFPNLEHVNLFTFESCLCAYKKLFRRKDGRYLGYYLDRHAGEIMRYEKENRWPDAPVDVSSILWNLRKDLFDPLLNGRTPVDESKMHYFLDTGKFERMNWMLPNVVSTAPQGLENFM